MAEGAIRDCTENQGEACVAASRRGPVHGGRIAASGHVPQDITAVLEAADATETSWDDVVELTDEQVYTRLFPGRGEHESVFAQPDWERVHREMARVGVTLKLLHSEYTDQCSASKAPAMGYDRWCKTYQRHVMVTGAASRVGHKGRPDGRGRLVRPHDGG